MTDYKEFWEPRLVTLYDILNPMGADSEFFCSQASRLSTVSIIDFGCGTGLLTCELARRGHKVIGVEPSKAMLDIARQRTYCEQVRWVEGGFEQLEMLKADLLLMTSHVAQFFLEEGQWQTALKAIHKCLTPLGHIVFDSRNPQVRPWENWTRATTSRKVDTASNGQVETWYQVSEVKGNRVRHEIHYIFIESSEELVSDNELIYRSQEEITQSLTNVGFSVEDVYGDWDCSEATAISPEMIFVARC